MGGGSPDKVTNIQEIPPEFKPHFLNLFGGASEAARQSAANSQPQTQGSPKIPTEQVPGQGGGVGQGLNQGGLFGGTGGFDQGQGGFNQNQPISGGAGGVVPSGISPLSFNPFVTSKPQQLLPQPTKDAAQELVGSPFGGQFIAGANPLEQAQIQQTANLAGQLQNAGQNTFNLGQAQASGQFLSPDSNPFLQQTINAAIRPQLEAFQNQILPGFESQALNAGAFKGSSARDLAQNQLSSGVLNQIGDTASNLAFQNFAKERQLQQNSGQLIDQGARLSQLSPTLLGQAGQSVRGLQQNALDDALLRFQEGVNAPFRPLFPLASILQGSNIGSTSTQTIPRPSPLATGIQGALGGAGGGAAISGALDLTGGQGAGLTGLGALLGGLGGGLG